MIKKYLLIGIIIFLASVLRLVSLDKFPAGLNAVEAALGYNAWSLIKTGKDEHSVSWPLVFRSFDDYKPGVYAYLTMPFIYIFGLNTWSVRLPSALLGILSVYLLYLIVNKLFPKHKYLGELSALILAVSPWHLQFSRGGWEVNAALFFILLGLNSFLLGLKNSKFFYLFVISFAISLYTYQSTKLITPLIALTLLVLYWKELFTEKTIKKAFLSACFLGIILGIPFLSQTLSKQGQSRFTGVSVFSDTGPLWQALEMRRNHDQPNFYVKVLHNQYLSYGLRFTKNYLSHYSPRFLFITGDEIARSKTPETGQSYFYLVPFYFLGLLSLLKLDTKSKRLTFLWFLIAPLAAALTFQSPHALRAQNMVIPLTLITALGIYEFFKFLDKYKVLYKILCFCIFGFLSFYYLGQYLHQYYVHYPKELPFAWQYGFDQIANHVKLNGDKYEKIIITDRYDQPYILLAFFLQYPPDKLQSQMVMTPRDKFGFSTLKKFDKFEFKSVDWSKDKESKDTLIFSSIDESVDKEYIIGNVLDPAGKVLFNISATNAKK